MPAGWGGAEVPRAWGGQGAPCTWTPGEPTAENPAA